LPVLAHILQVVFWVTEIEENPVWQRTVTFPCLAGIALPLQALTHVLSQNMRENIENRETMFLIQNIGKTCKNHW